MSETGITPHERIMLCLDEPIYNLALLEGRERFEVTIQVDHFKPTGMTIPRKYKHPSLKKGKNGNG